MFILIPTALFCVDEILVLITSNIYLLRGVIKVKQEEKISKQSVLLSTLKSISNRMG